MGVRAAGVVRAAGAGTGQKGRSGKFEAASATCRIRNAAAMFRRGGGGVPCRFFGDGSGTDNGATQVEWEAAYPPTPAVPLGIPYPTNGYRLQEGAGTGPAVDFIGGQNLTAVQSGSYTFGLAESSLGANAVDRRAVRISNSGGALRAATTSVLDLTTQDFSLFCRFIITGAYNTNGRRLWRKQTTSAGANGWYLQINALGRVTLQLDTPAAGSISAVVGGQDHDDATWYDCLAVIDRTNGELRIRTQRGSGVASIAAHAGGSASNATSFGYGDPGAFNNNSFRGACSLAYVWDGTALPTEAFPYLIGE